MFARDFLSLHTAPLPFPKTPASKSRVSITSKLIQTKALQVALLTSSTGGAMPQAVEVVGESEQEGLSDLHDQATARSARRQLAFHHREDGFYLRPLSVLFLRKLAIHLPAQRSLRNTPTWLRWTNTLHPPALPNMQVIGFGIELGIGQHQAQWCASCRRIH